VALWATPTLSGARNAGKPNIVLYVIDGGGAEYMSVYGYNRRTTPNLERLAAEGALFERAYSNAFWSQPSTMSFMTSLHNSVLGGVDTPMPEQAVTMAQHLHDDGYQTAVFTGNPLAGRRSSLDRGVDALRDEAMWYTAAPSSFALQQEFWRWREAFPGQPFWVHFQTVDVHSGGRAMLLPPFGGLYLEPARRAEYLQWERQVGWWYDDDGALERFEEAGVDPLEYYDRVQRVYSEGMAAQDHQIGKLVERLKRTGEWSNTLLIVAADHGQFETGLVQLEPYPPLGQHTNLRPERTRVPMIFVWPGHIAGGQRFTDPVSMIDMLAVARAATSRDRRVGTAAGDLG
jgi:arylsulfatase A-like enzyme